MFKRIVIIVIAVVMAVMLASASFGTVKEYGPFTVDVPKGWTLKKFGDHGFELKRFRGNGYLYVEWGNLDGNSLEDFAKFLSDRWHGSNFRYDAFLEAYRFAFMVKATTKYNALVRGFDNSDIVAVISWSIFDGTIKKDELGQILDSLQLK